MKHVKLSSRSVMVAVLIAFSAATPALAAAPDDGDANYIAPAVTLPTVVVTPSKAQMAELVAERRLEAGHKAVPARVAQNADDRDTCRSATDGHARADEKCPL